MAHPKLLFVLDLICFLAFSYLLFRLLTKSKATHPSLPPGLYGLPLIGNTHQIPSSKQWKVYARWGRKYGDIVSISVFGQRLVILNSVERALEMLDVKGAIYSDTEITPMIKLSGWAPLAVFLNPGHMFRRQRALIHQPLGTPSALSQFDDLIEDESSTFLQYVLNPPLDLESHIRHFAGSVILRVTYGYRTKGHDDPFIGNVVKCLEDFTVSAAPGTWIVDFLPSLASVPSWFPGIQLKKMSKKFSESVQKLVNDPYEFAREQMITGTAIPSFVSTSLENWNLQATPEDIHTIKWASAIVYGAGADTTVSAISGFFWKWQSSLMYSTRLETRLIQSLELKGFRYFRTELACHMWMPSSRRFLALLFGTIMFSTLGIPHKSSKDDIHAGYFIPRGSIVIPNVSFMLKDPCTYKDPEQFNPERYLGDHPERDPRQMAFGFGRRVCPGRLFADETIFIVVSRSITLLQIQKTVKNGVVVEPVYHLVPSFVCHPAPYEINVKPRSKKAVLLVKAGCV